MSDTIRCMRTIGQEDHEFSQTRGAHDNFVSVLQTKASLSSCQPKGYMMAAHDRFIPRRCVGIRIIHQIEPVFLLS